jgi:hypothetical protein
MALLLALTNKSFFKKRYKRPFHGARDHVDEMGADAPRPAATPQGCSEGLGEGGCGQRRGRGHGSWTTSRRAGRAGHRSYLHLPDQHPHLAHGADCGTIPTRYR